MFCIAINQELRGTRCPLASGKCMWQHKRTNACTYTDKSMDTSEFCARVGVTEPSSDQVQAFLHKLKESV